MKNTPMFIGKIFAICGIIVMAGALTYGFVWGEFLKEGGILLSIPWGIITLIDIYISFFAFCGWIFYRESSWVLSIIWTLLVIVLGSFTICLYLFLAFQKSDGSWQKFLHGSKTAISNDQENN
ncbi:MAG: DUF1475 domain-containing protein [Candidatus Heimdallarchaeota archaeon]|nr:DUF1475 domain-containing protein [Candidatus Heimdallarchaeota archaeon]